MILPDVNLLVHAYNGDAPAFAAAKAWWERTLSEGTAVFLPWAVLLGFVRLTTSPKVVPRPVPVRCPGTPTGRRPRRRWPPSSPTVD